VKAVIFLTLILTAVKSYAHKLPVAFEEPIFSGPNCHNTALFATGKMQSIRYIREDEMIQILDRHCEKVEEASEEMIGVLELGPSNRPMHSFVKLDSGKVLTKNGVSKRAKAEISSYRSMLSLHQGAVAVDCKRKGIEKKDCQLKAQYYSCEKLAPMKVEMVLTSFYDKREKFFDLDNQKKIIQAMEIDRLSINSNSCAKFNSVAQSLDIVNWNSRGLEEYEQFKQFVAEFNDRYKEFFCATR
jgi:hypothetical protein